MLVRQVSVRHEIGTSAERRHNARVLAQVTLWRVIAISVLLLPLGVIVASERTYRCKPPTAYEVKAYAFEAFPQWAAAHPWLACPQSIDELSEYTQAHLVDQWGMKLEMRCTPHTRLYVRSAGPDTRFDTADDITSND